MSNRAPASLFRLSAFATMHVSNTPLSIPHQGQFPAATISFNLRSGSSLSHAIPAIEKAEREIGSAEYDCHHVHRRRGRIPLLADQRTVSDFGRRDRDLHRARCSLRELHSSDHYSLDVCLRPASARCSRCCFVELIFLSSH